MEKEWKSVVENLLAKGILKEKHSSQKDEVLTTQIADQDFLFAKPISLKNVIFKDDLPQERFIKDLKDMISEVNKLEEANGVKVLYKISNLFENAVNPEKWSEFKNGKNKTLSNETVYAIASDIFSELAEYYDPDTLNPDYCIGKINKLLGHFGRQFAPNSDELDYMIRFCYESGVYKIEEIDKIIDFVNEELVNELNKKNEAKNTQIEERNKTKDSHKEKLLPIYEPIHNIGLKKKKNKDSESEDNS